MGLRGNVFRAADSGNVQRAEHDGILTVRQGDNDLVTDNRRVFGVFDAKDFAAAAMNGERGERRAFQVEPDLLKHGPKVAPALGRGNSLRFLRISLTLAAAS
jgi:hypothetical protein